MKLEYGKRYVTRNGRPTGPLVKDNAHIFSFRCNLIGCNWTEDGNVYTYKDSDLDIVREYAGLEALIGEPAKPEPTMQTRVVKMAVMPKGEPTYSENTTMIEIDEFPGGAVLLVSQDHDDPDIKGKVAISPEEWPAIKTSIETMLGYIDEAEKEDEA